MPGRTATHLPCALGFLLLIAGITTLQGCNTPQALLDQANQGASLSLSLQTEMANFRAVQAAIAQQRLDSIRTQLSSIATLQSETDFEERLRKAAGTATTAALYSELRTLTDSRMADEKQLQQQLLQIDTDLAKLTSPLPDTAQALGNTQKALAVMGDELPVKSRLDAVAQFAGDIKKSIEDNKEKIEAAKGNSPEPPSVATE